MTHGEKAKQAFKEGRYHTYTPNSGNVARMVFIPQNDRIFAHVVWEWYPPSKQDMDETAIFGAVVVAEGRLAPHDKPFPGGAHDPR